MSTVDIRCVILFTHNVKAYSVHTNKEKFLLHKKSFRRILWIP